MTILETPRLSLREFCAADTPDAFELNNDPDVIKYTGDNPFESLEAAKRFLENYDHYTKYGFGRWAVIEKESKSFLGWCGLKYEAELMEYDLGYRLAKRYWNRGFATEAAAACLQFGFETLGMKRIVARSMRANEASIKVMQRVGMKFWKECQFEKHDGVVYFKEVGDGRDKLTD